MKTGLPQIKKAFISFRIGTTQWMPEKRFQELLRLFVKYKGITDEITFFTSETHPPLPLEVIKKRAALLTERMTEVRKKGYKTGINILATIGHHNENLPNSLSGDYTHMTDIDGNVCLGSFCPNGENMRGYIKQVYEILTGTHPDYIWIDDDVRLWGHFPIDCGCFCQTCLSIFEKESGVKYTRASLKNVLNNGALKEKMEIRRMWLQHNRNTIASLMELIEGTVHGLNPNLPLGFMTGDRFFEGYDFDKWAKILSGCRNAEVMWRPGGGFYADDCLEEFLGKSHDIGRQVSMLPDDVVSIQSEIENFPYQRLKKAARTTILEAASYIASGCTGAAFNVLSMYDEPLDEYEPLIAKLSEARPFFDLMAQKLGRAKPQGVYSGWSKDSFAVNNIAEGDWLKGEFWKIAGAHLDEILKIGIPPSYSLSFAPVTVLSGDGILGLDTENITKILSSGVYLDARALTRLNEMGYEKLTGFSVERFVENDCMEEFVDHPLNGIFNRRRRDGRQSFWKEPAAVLKPQDKKAETLARLVDYGNKEIAPCCLGVFENQLGGRICVAGYYPWIFLRNLSKSTQIKSIMRWLSKDTLPAYIASFHKINMWVREPERGRFAVVIVNACLDPATNLTLMLRTERNELSVIDMNCAKTQIHSCGTDGPYQKFILPVVGAWDMRLIV